jgi:hypothetical protein
MAIYDEVIKTNPYNILIGKSSGKIWEKNGNLNCVEWRKHTIISNLWVTEVRVI